MAIELSTTAKLLSEKTKINPQIILEIDGYDEIFGAVEVTKACFIGMPELYIGDDWRVGGNIEIVESRPYISLDGTTKNITQQLRQDKGGSSSVTSVKIRMIDKNSELTNLFFYSSGQDIISRSAKVYMGFANTDHPADSVKILDGIIEDIDYGAGFVDIAVGHPEQLKRQELFINVLTVTTAYMSDSQTWVTVDTTNGFNVGANEITSYIRIDDEIIKYESTSSTQFSTLTRGQLGTTAAAHDSDSEVSSFYRLEGGAIDLALKLMLSQGVTYFVDSEEVSSFEFVDLNTSINNAVVFADKNFVDVNGITIGDICTTSGATNATNNISSKTVVDIQKRENAVAVVLDGVSFVSEEETNAVCSFQSQYNTLNQGCGLLPSQVDIAGHQEQSAINGANFHTYDFYLKDTIEAKAFIENEIYFPSGLYSLPRFGRSSVGFTSPPLVQSLSPVINSENTKNLDKIKVKRSVNKNFYNAINYKYDELAIDDKFQSGLLTLDVDSSNRIKMGNRPMLIEAKGIRTSLGGKSLMELQSRRFLDRYKFAAEEFDVEVLYGTGFNLDVGDIVIFGDSDMKLTDSDSGTRAFEPRLCEITNKSMNIVNGNIKLKLVDTSYQTDARFASISGSSIIGTGSTTSKIIITSSFGYTQLEKNKWSQYLGQEVLIRNDDFSVQLSCTLDSFDPSNDFAINVTGLSSAPVAGYIMQSPIYPDNTNKDDQKYWKNLHGFFAPQVTIQNGIDNFTFDLQSTTDADKFFIGSVVRVHVVTYALDSGPVTVTNISGLRITVDTDIGFTPGNGHKVSGIGFKDEQQSYGWI